MFYNKEADRDLVRIFYFPIIGKSIFTDGYVIENTKDALIKVVGTNNIEIDYFIPGNTSIYALINKDTDALCTNIERKCEFFGKTFYNKIVIAKSDKPFYHDECKLVSFNAEEILEFLQELSKNNFPDITDE